MIAAAILPLIFARLRLIAATAASAPGCSACSGGGNVPPIERDIAAWSADDPAAKEYRGPLAVEIEASDLDGHLVLDRRWDMSAEIREPRVGIGWMALTCHLPEPRLTQISSNANIIAPYSN